MTKTSREYFRESHRRVWDRTHTFVEIMQGPNPLTADEIRALAKKHPRYEIFLPYAERLSR